MNVSHVSSPCKRYSKSICSNSIEISENVCKNNYPNAHIEFGISLFNVKFFKKMKEKQLNTLKRLQKVLFQMMFFVWFLFS
jgi:hypothetical protein